VLRIENQAVDVERHVWRPAERAFVRERVERFRRDGQRWVELSA